MQTHKRLSGLGQIYRFVIVTGSVLTLLFVNSISSEAQGEDTSQAGANISGFSFQPSPLNIPAGTTVVWTNQDPTTHTVTSGVTGAPDGMFDSGPTVQNGSFSMTFTDPGTYTYFCKFHPFMQGVVMVSS